MRRLRAKLDAQNCYPHHRYPCCLLWSFDHSHQFLPAASSASESKARRLTVSMHSMGVCRRRLGRDDRKHRLGR
jgi:hypothetical protein